MEEVKVQVRFTLEDGFTDAIYYSLEEYENLDEAKHEKLKKERHANWKKASQAQEIELTDEQKRENAEAQLKQAEAELEVLNEDFDKKGK